MNGRLVKSSQFEKFRDVGDPLKSSQVYADQDADELIILNVDRENRVSDDLIPWLRKISQTCFMPIAAGGGVRSIEDALALFEAGTDKVVINSAAYENPNLLEQIAARWGSQALVVSIDVKRSPDGSYGLYNDCARRSTSVDLVTHMTKVVDVGAGEIFLNSIDRDGVMKGYDLDLLASVRPHCDVPLIICGGAGNYTHLLDAFELGVDAVACGSLFNFGDNNPLRVKSFLKNRNVSLKRI
jgi:imidazole glycerol-phosphate synthase subunit HisF